LQDLSTSKNHHCPPQWSIFIVIPTIYMYAIT
jgi:hypothetical protein